VIKVLDNPLEIIKNSFKSSKKYEHAWWNYLGTIRKVSCLEVSFKEKVNSEQISPEELT
jgi:hypothetical protein